MVYDLKLYVFANIYNVYNERNKNWTILNDVNVNFSMEFGNIFNFFLFILGSI